MNRARTGAGPVAVVTGASRGLGAGMAQRVRRPGPPAGLVRPDPSGADRSEPSRSSPRSMSPTRAAVDAFAAAVVERLRAHRPVGQQRRRARPHRPVADADPVALHANLDTNILGVVHGSAAFARHVRARPGTASWSTSPPGRPPRPTKGGRPTARPRPPSTCSPRSWPGRADRTVSAPTRWHPGHVDTDMQALIRSTLRRALPSVGRFQRRLRGGRLQLAGLGGPVHPRPSSPPGPIMAGWSAASGEVRLRVPDER